MSEQGKKWTILVSLSTTVTIESCPSGVVGRAVIRSIDIEVQGLEGIGRG